MYKSVIDYNVFRIIIVIVLLFLFYYLKQKKRDHGIDKKRNNLTMGPPKWTFYKIFDENLLYCIGAFTFFHRFFKVNENYSHIQFLKHDRSFWPFFFLELVFKP